MNAMTASIAHEIRQPLTGIMANSTAGLRWLKRSDPDLSKVQAVLEQIQAGRADRQIVAGTRDMFSKSQRKALIDVSIVADQVLALVQGELETNQISLRNEMQGRPTEVFGDRIQLQQVLLNLIMNAIEAMSSETSRERNLMITSGIDDGIKVRITVEDTGGGIDPAHLDRIFDPFFTTKSNGMGLGLSICRSIIEAHGGRLSASPRSPFGTAFHLILPIAGAAATEVKADQGVIRN